jgi:mannose-6-phosphate isomerase-like protein (cupin superfamily)
MKFTVNEFLEKLPLPADGKWMEGVCFATAFRRRNVTLEFFAPRGKDYQTAHSEDEFYFIVSGNGKFIKENERMTFTAGDVLFVEADIEHHFENFSADFSAWVVFF